jgi:hypothetical protein
MSRLTNIAAGVCCTLLGTAHLQAHGERVIMGLMRAKGVMGITFARDRIESDFNAHRRLRRVEETYYLLDPERARCTKATRKA